MPALNPALVSVADPPIMEAMGWVRGKKFPSRRPLINLSQAAPTGLPPEPIREALSKAILSDPAAHSYGPVLGNDALRTEIAKRWSADYGATIAETEVAVTAGCNQAFCVAVATACGPGDAVMLPWPWYFNHAMWLEMSGIRCIPVPCDDAMVPDLVAARLSMVPEVRAIALVTPNNPTGAEYPDGLLQGFYDLAQRQGAVLIVDETYRDFRTAEGPAHTLFQRGDWHETLVHLYSFSKAFRLTGHRTGAMIAGADRLAQSEKFLDTMTISPPQSGQIAALEGLRTQSDWVAGERREILARQDALREAFAEHIPEWTVHGAGAYFAWVSPPFDEDPTALARRIVDEQSVLLLPGSMFVPAGTQTRAFRVACANADADTLRQTAKRLAKVKPGN